MKSRICIIFTGGTIGSSVEGDTVGLRSDNKSILLDLYREKYGTDVEFSELRPIDILSENVQISDLYAIADCVHSVNCDSFDGIIITHGTDTLCFTANLFSQIFCDIKIPLVFVSALYPLDDKRSQGLNNFACAVDFIRLADYGGVFVSFTNPEDSCKIHLGSRITFAEQINGYFYSILNEAFAEVVDDKISYIQSELNPTVEELKAERNPYGEYSICGDIVICQARSLLDFSFYNFDKKKPKAVLVELYHSGTVCTAGENTNFLKFARNCRNADIPVIVSPVDSTAGVYESAKMLKDECICAYDLSFEMTVVKVMLALGEGKDIRCELSTNHFFEKLHR